MNRGKSLVCALLTMVCALSFTIPVSAHSVFKKNLAAKYPDKKISCTACHDKKDKKIRTNYGKLLQKQFESKTLTADWKSKKGAEKKAFETEAMLPEFEKAFAKVKAMTVHDLIEAGYFEGIDNPEESE